MEMLEMPGQVSMGLQTEIPLGQALTQIYPQTFPTLITQTS
jgi:hypothetical protein